MTSRTADARALLQQYVQRLHSDVDYFTHGRVFHRTRDVRIPFLPRQTWIALPIRINPSEDFTTDVRTMRAFVEVVGRLNACADFGLRAFYHGIWKSEVFDKLKQGPPSPTEYDDPTQLLSLDVAQAPRFLLDLSYETVTSAHVALLREFFFVNVAEALGGDNDALLSRLTARSGVTTTRRAPVVEIGLGSSNRVDSVVLQEFYQLVQDVQQQQQQQQDGERVRLDLSTLWMDKLELSTSTDLTALTAAVASPSSSIQHLYLSELVVEAEKRGDDMKAAFQTFTRAVLSSKASLRSLCIPRSLISHREFAQLCSALRCASELRELSVHLLLARLELAEQDRDWYAGWAWLAFAVLHPDSAIRLDRLDISGFPLEAKNVELVAEIITCVRPGRRLWELEHGALPSAAADPEFEEIDLPADQRFFVSLTPNDGEVATILNRPDSEAPVLFTIEGATKRFEVLLLLSGWVCVVVPGYGCGWAPSAVITSQETKPTKCALTSLPSSSATHASWPQAGANVKHLERNDEYSVVYDVSPVKHLLEMVGHSLVGLDLEVYSIGDNDVGEILDACPNLTYLNLDGDQLSNISALLDRYRSGECKITHLDVTSEVLGNHIVAQLAELLAEPAGQTLLCVCAGGINDHYDTHPEPFAALASVLLVNKTLQYLRLKCRSLDKIMRAQLQHNMLTHESIYHERSTTVAFVSVVTAKEAQASSLSSLDAKMLAHVLSFARISIKRKYR